MPVFLSLSSILLSDSSAACPPKYLPFPLHHPLIFPLHQPLYFPHQHHHEFIWVHEYILYCTPHQQGESLGLQNDEYAIRTAHPFSFGLISKNSESRRKVCNGNSVIVNEECQADFDKFKTTILTVSSTGAHIVIKATDLISFWMRSCKTSLPSIYVLGETYYLMHPSQMDDFCQWIYDTRDRCCDDGITVEKLLSLNPSSH